MIHRAIISDRICITSAKNLLSNFAITARLRLKLSSALQLPLQNLRVSHDEILNFWQGAVLTTMWRSHAKTFIMIGFIKLFDNVLTFASPLLLEQLLLSLQEGKPAGTHSFQGQQRTSACMAFGVLQTCPSETDDGSVEPGRFRI